MIKPRRSERKAVGLIAARDAVLGCVRQEQAFRQTPRKDLRPAHCAETAARPAGEGRETAAPRERVQGGPAARTTVPSAHAGRACNQRS